MINFGLYLNDSCFIARVKDRSILQEKYIFTLQ